MSNDVYVTEAGLAQLKQELKQLSEVERVNIAARIKEARDFGDLSENAEYTSAKEDQARNETKILQLEEKVRNAVLISANQNAKAASLGSTIKVEDLATSKQNQYTLVGSTEANPSKGLLSNESPVGKALLGKKVGQEAAVSLPRGVRKLRILSIS